MRPRHFSFLLIILLSMFGIKLFAHDIEVENADGVTIYYVWKNDKTELAVSYKGPYYYSTKDGYSGSVTIPESVEYNGKTYKVTTIGEYAFTHCLSLTSVTIPNSVTTIGHSAFSSCRLTSINIPNSVTTIGEGAFFHCDKLTSINIPNSVVTIEKRTFQDCSSLTNITIPNSITTIGERAFDGCI